MRTFDHVTKAQRIESTMSGHLDPDADYEMYVEACMLAGTHLLNALLHRYAVTDEASDLLHSDKPALSVSVPPELKPLFDAMKFIEDLRPGYLRGTTAWDPAHGRQCRNRYDEVKKFVQQALC
jgi:hypothetical protein